MYVLEKRLRIEKKTLFGKTECKTRYSQVIKGSDSKEKLIDFLKSEFSPVFEFWAANETCIFRSAISEKGLFFEFEIYEIEVI